MPLTQDISDNDLRAVAQGAARIGAPPFDVLQVLYTESGGFKPSIFNPSGCVGLNQFCQSTFSGAVRGLTMQQYAGLSAADQITRYIVPFWLSLPTPNSALTTARDLYWVNWRRDNYHSNAPDSFVVYSGPLGADSVLAHGKSFVTAGDLQAFLNEHTLPFPRFHELSSRLVKISPASNIASSAGPGLFLAAAALVGVVLYTKG